MTGWFVDFLIPVAVCLALFYHAGTLKEMITFTILENFKYPNIYRPLYLLNLRNICFFLLALAGLIMEYVLNHTGPQDVVFDGESAYVFRPQAYFYGSLFHAIVWRIQRGEITQDIPQSLIKTDCRWVIYDERVATLPQPVQVFLKANYEASEFPGIYRAKKH